ncbi:MAG: signal peptidase II [Emergencia sp.]
MPRSLYMRYYLLGLGLLIIDQLTKMAIRARLAVGESVDVLGSFFRITHVENEGAAFSILMGRTGLLIAVTLIVVVLAIGFMHTHKGKHWLMYTSGAMIISGGIGNLIDRALFGHVTDMFDFSIFPPVFNVADIAVVVGCGLCLVYVIFEDRLNGTA